MIFLYLGLSVVAVALFMGFPVGTLTLGTLTGIYMGRRARHYPNEWNTAFPYLSKTAFITASVTTIAALPIGILALNEQDNLRMLANLSGIRQISLQGVAGYTLIAFLCGFLFLIQYWFSKKAGVIAFNMGIRNAQH
jgi:hypothetical protein